MVIWAQQPTLEGLNQTSTKNMGEHLGINFTEVGDDYIIATMPVNERTRQPYGVLHGGASVALAETVGSVASVLVVGFEKRCVGLEINANHVSSAKEGLVYAKATALHLGKSTHVWDIKITNEQDKLICICRLTTAILN